MGRQIRLLLGISLCNLLRLNEFRHTKDKKKKTRYRLMGLLWCVLIVMLMGYVGGLSWGLSLMGMGYLTPAVLSMLVSVVVFLFTVLKAGTVLFERNAYEKQIALPVTVRAVLVSRFLTMYVSDMVLGMLVMLPGMAVYGVMEKPGISFYLYGILGGLFLPLLPLTLASAAGALITGLSSRWRQKNIAAIVLTMLLICLILAGSFGMSGMEESRLVDFFQQMAPLMEAQLRRVYPPAVWLGEAMVNGKISMLFLFLGASAGCFVLFLEILHPFYAGICSLLGAHGAKGGYRMKELNARPVLRSMISRELRRYFSSVVYVTNTMVGNLLMVIFAAAVLIMGKETMEELIGMPGIVERAAPVLLGMMAAMMPMTSCAVSMEGKQWWMMQTFPVSGKDIVRSKMWADILVALPFYLASEVLLMIAFKPAGLGLLGFWAVPAVYILFAAKAGIVINCRFPVFDWEDETKVVKQSAATMITTFAGMISGAVPIGVLVCFRDIPAYVIYAAVSGVLLGLALLLPSSLPRGVEMV